MIEQPQDGQDQTAREGMTNIDPPLSHGGELTTPMIMEGTTKPKSRTALVVGIVAALVLAAGGAIWALVGQDGSEKVAAGHQMTIDEIQEIDWYIKGIEGQIQS